MDWHKHLITAFKRSSAMPMTYCMDLFVQYHPVPAAVIPAWPDPGTMQITMRIGRFLALFYRKAYDALQDDLPDAEVLRILKEQ